MNHFTEEMTGRMRFSSPAVRAEARAAYIKLFNNMDPKYDYHRAQFYDLIMALKLAELPDPPKVEKKKEPYIMRAVIELQGGD